MIRVDPADVESRALSRGQQSSSLSRDDQSQGIEDFGVAQFAAGGGVTAGKARGQIMDACGNFPQPLRSMPHCIHARHHGQQHLGRAYIAGGLLPADVLLPRLQGEPIRRLSLGINTPPDQTSRQLAFPFIPAGHEGRVWSAKSQGHAESLRTPHGHIRPQFTRWRQQSQTQQITRHDHQHAATAQAGDACPPIRHLPIRRGILEHRCKDAVIIGKLVAGDNFQSQSVHPRVQHLLTLGKKLRSHQHLAGMFHLRAGQTQRHGLRHRSAFVQETRVGHGQSRQLTDHRLEIHERLHATLGNFRLIRRVGGIPAGVFQHISLDDRRSERAVVTLTQEIPPHLILIHDPPQFGQRLLFRGGCRKLHWFVRADASGDRRIDQGLK